MVPANISMRIAVEVKMFGVNAVTGSIPKVVGYHLLLDTLKTLYCIAIDMLRLGVGRGC